ncbi:MAG: sulfotransferase, partial [Pseudomonadota bacterium]
VIVGAAKCGTTTLCQYLAAHPGIFLSPIKEPNYLCSDAPDLRAVQEFEQYERLFSQATPT